MANSRPSDSRKPIPQMYKRKGFEKNLNNGGAADSSADWLSDLAHQVHILAAASATGRFTSVREAWKGSRDAENLGTKKSLEVADKAGVFIAAPAPRCAHRLTVFE